VIARSPIARLIAWKQERGWKKLRLFSDLNGAYSRDSFGILPDGSEIPAFNVFTRRDGTIRHFWSAEMTGSTADPGQDPRGAPDPAPLWMVLDSTPEGRGRKWYPKLDTKWGSHHSSATKRPIGRKCSIISRYSTSAVQMKLTVGQVSHKIWSQCVLADHRLIGFNPSRELPSMAGLMSNTPAAIAASYTAIHLRPRAPRRDSVRRQSFWDREWLKLRESLARLFCDVMRLADGAASGDWRLSVV
jgi:Bacterial protein of unknown function (DUF899)